MKIEIWKEFDTKAEAEAFAERTYRNYNPCAYDTSLDLVERDGKFVIKGYRFDNAD